jgi:hypothetical protein
LFLVVSNASYKRASHRLDLIDDPSGDAMVQDSYLNAGSPDANNSGLVFVRAGTISGTKKTPIFALRPVVSRLPRGAQIIKAEYRIYITAIIMPVTMTVHRVIPAAAIDEVTWNEARSGVPWAVAGAKGEGDDYVASSLGSMSPGATGWFTLMSGENFSDEVNARKAEEWFAVGKEYDYSGNWSATAFEGSGNRPVLRVWYE